jgi:penicillin-binding protein 1A
MAGVTNDGGTADVVNIPGAVGKTGTSDEYKDLWFIGYVPGNLVTGIWLGNKAGFRDPTKATSGDAAALWQRYMEALGYPSGNQ